jgi:multidrug resistance efflux pump
MLIILTLYLVLLWLIFSKLKLVRWGWVSGSAAVLIGAFILAVFMAMFNYLTPSGSFVVISRVVEVAPNVSGQVTEIPVQTNVPVKTGTTLFKIDAAPFQYKVDQLEASLAGARQQALQLKANYAQASANVELYVRAENLTDARYQEVKDYGSAGRSFYAGVRATW